MDHKLNMSQRGHAVAKIACTTVRCINRSIACKSDTGKFVVSTCCSKTSAGGSCHLSTTSQEEHRLPAESGGQWPERSQVWKIQVTQSELGPLKFWGDEGHKHGNSIQMLLHEKGCCKEGGDDLLAGLLQAPQEVRGFTRRISIWSGTGEKHPDGRPCPDLRCRRCTRWGRQPLLEKLLPWALGALGRIRRQEHGTHFPAPRERPVFLLAVYESLSCRPYDTALVDHIFYLLCRAIVLVIN